MVLKILRILAFLLCLVLFFFLCFHPGIETDKADDNITITLVDKNATLIRKLPLGSTFKDLNVRSGNISDEHVLYDNEIIDIVNETEGKVSINSAGIEELVSLPGIGPVIASRIVEYRQKYGIFEKLEEIKLVSGIGEKKYEAIKNLIVL